MLLDWCEFIALHVLPPLIFKWTLVSSVFCWAIFFLSLQKHCYNLYSHFWC